MSQEYCRKQRKKKPKVMNFLSSFDSTCLLCDVGCGNGRYLENDHLGGIIGIDMCFPLLENAKLSKHEVSFYIHPNKFRMMSISD